MINVTFLMEQHVGHQTFCQNLRRFIEPSTQLNSKWVGITYYTEQNYLWERLPFVPAQIRASLTARMQVRDGLQQTPYDVALFNTQVPAVLGSAFLKKQPYVIATDITPIQYDGMGEHYNHHSDGNTLLSRYKHWKNVNIFKGAARILPWSDWVSDSLIADYGVDPNRIEVVPPGVDIDKWHDTPNRSNDGPVRILFVGGDLYRKGGQLLLDAFQSLPAGVAELILVTRTEVTATEGVTVYNNMQPNTPELMALYQSSDIFVLPTQAEAFGIAAVEACASGMPVVATNIGALPYIVRDGETGFIIEVQDQLALANRLHQLIENYDMRQRFGRAARQRVETHFDAEKNAMRVIKILQDVAAE